MRVSGPTQGAIRIASGVHGRRLERAQHPVDRPDLGARAGDRGSLEVDVAIDAFDVEAIGRHGVVVAAEEEVDLVTSFGEASAVVAADGARADHGDAAHASLPSSGRRAILPVTRRPGEGRERVLVLRERIGGGDERLELAALPPFEQFSQRLPDQLRLVLADLAEAETDRRSVFDE